MSGRYTNIRADMLWFNAGFTPQTWVMKIKKNKKNDRLVRKSLLLHGREAFHALSDLFFFFFTVRWLCNLAVSLESCCNQTSWDDIQWSHKNFGREANTVLASYISLMFKAAVTAEAPHCSASFCWDGPWGNRKLLPLTREGCWWTTCTTS